MNPWAAIQVRAAELRLPFLLAGGHAVIVHGYARTTFDLDLIILRSDQARWRELAHDLGYRFHHEGPTFLQFDPPQSDLLPLDLMLVNQATFDKLMAEAAPGPRGAESVKVVSVLHLLALKAHAIKHGHKTRVVKDADDIIHLIQVNALKVEDPAIRDLFLHYGTEELYEKIRRVCGGT
mgnify:CR=1 FL=1